jgi:hypothetical protein
MSSWNYRVVRHLDPTEPQGYVFAMHEVHYDDQGKPVAMTERPCGIVSDKVFGLSEILNKMREAFEKPVLNAEDIASTPEEAP